MFLFGDYEFLTKVYGLSGAAAIHPCLWCKVTQTGMQPNPAQQLQVDGRTLDGIRKDHERFQTIGKGALKDAQLFNNVIHPPIWDIPPFRACPPYLHINIGIVTKHHKLLEEACHNIDLQIAQHIAKQDDAAPDTSTKFGNCIFHLKKLSQLEMQKEKLENQKNRADNEMNTPLATCRKRIAAFDLKIKQTEKKIEVERKKSKLEPRAGPVASNLDRVLNKHEIALQAYHGRSFNGNHSNKYLEENVFGDLCDSVSSQTKDLVNEDNIEVQAASVTEKFRELNRRYSLVHTAVSHCEPVTYTECQDSDELISNYMRYFRRMFPEENVIPKQHILEAHVPCFMSKWKTGMGKYGEQGGEQIHATINRLKGSFQNKKCGAKRLRFIVRKSHLPLLINLHTHKKTV